MQVSSASSAQALEQANRMRQRMFSRADQDSSGGLSLDELRAMRPGNSGTQAADSAGTTAATDRSAEIFARLDTDGDGSASAVELETGREVRHARGGHFSAASMSTLLSGQEASDADARFSSLDTDGDGRLSASEFAAARPAGSPPPDGAEAAGANAQADTLAELVRKALASYLQVGSAATQSQAATLVNA